MAVQKYVILEPLYLTKCPLGAAEKDHRRRPTTATSHDLLTVFYPPLLSCNWSKSPQEAATRLHTDTPHRRRSGGNLWVSLG